MIHSRAGKVIGIVALSVITLALLALFSPATAPTSEPSPTLATIKVIPDVGSSRQNVKVIGYNATPKEEVVVTIEQFPGVETMLNIKGKKISAVANELGCFELPKGPKLPTYPGVYPVRLYDSKGDLLAVTVVHVKKKKKKAKK